LILCALMNSLYLHLLLIYHSPCCFIFCIYYQY
jgi:hypothetical protein